MDLNYQDTEKYFKFYLQKITPKIEEIIEADSFKRRKKIQKEIIVLIREAGYVNEALKMKAVFNL